MEQQVEMEVIVWCPSKSLIVKYMSMLTTLIDTEV